MKVMGIDIGTTTISMVLTEADTGKMIARETVEHRSFLKSEIPEQKIKALMKKVVQSGSDRERNICWKFLENGLHEDHFEAVRRRMDSEALPCCPVIGCKSKN